MLLRPVMGSFIVSRKGWRWTQWTLIFFAIFCMIQLPFIRETFNPNVKRRLAKKKGLKLPPKVPLSAKLSLFARVAVIRPVHMLFAEPIVTFLCLYVAVNFGILFSFFAGVPYTFGLVYHFDLESSGLIFLSIAIGCIVGFLTIILCDVFIYRKKLALYPPLKTPPEHRLYPAMIGSLGLPIGLFWYAWSARADVSWASPAVAIFPFAWGNLCVFVSSVQYISDTYHGTVIASAVSANGLARYGFAGAFPLFTIQSKLPLHKRQELQIELVTNIIQCTTSLESIGLAVSLALWRWSCCPFPGFCLNSALKFVLRASTKLWTTRINTIRKKAT